MHTDTRPRPEVQMDGPGTLHPCTVARSHATNPGLQPSFKSSPVGWVFPKACTSLQDWAFSPVTQTRMLAFAEPAHATP
ncbi:hypothetical protein ACFX19_006165 [Malus domestica]